MRRCEECGFDWDADVDAAAVRASGERFSKPLSRFLKDEDPNVLLRTRIAPGVWSAIEYAAHTRDVFDFYADRIEHALTEDRPQLRPGSDDYDAVAIERDYNAADPTEIAAAVAQSAEACAALLDDIEADAWARVGIGSDGGERSVMELARRAVHDAQHHLLDIGRVLRGVRQGSRPSSGTAPAAR